MAGTKDEKMSLADVYAESVLLIACEQGMEDEVAAGLADLVSYMDSDPDFNAFMTADTVDDDPRRESLEKLFRGKMNDLVLNLLQVLNNRFRCDLIRAVQRCVELRLKAKHHQQEVIVETAMPLTDELRAAIKKDISERIGKEALLIEEVRPELIGGLVIHVGGDVQIDGSVESHIDSMKKRLFDRATQEVNRGRDYVVEA